MIVIERATRRLTQLFAGLALYGASMALMIESGLGLDPWDVFHQGLSEVTGLRFGLVVILVGAAVLLLWIPLRQRPGIGTVANVVVIGLAADATLLLLPTAGPLPVRIAFSVGGVFLNGVATGLYIGARLGPGPRDGLMTGFVARWPRRAPLRGAHRRMGRAPLSSPTAQRQRRRAMAPGSSATATSQPRKRMALAALGAPLAKRARSAEPQGSIRVVRTVIEVTVLAVGWLLGGTVGVGTVLYALAIGPLAHVFIPLFTVPAGGSASAPPTGEPRPADVPPHTAASPPVAYEPRPAAAPRPSQEPQGSASLPATH